MPAYLKIDNIKGDAKAKAHEDWIELTSVNYGLSRRVSTQPGKVYDRECSGSPQLDEIRITKNIDSSSSELYRLACQGKVIPKVTIDFCQTDVGFYPLMTLVLTDVIVSRFDDAYSEDSDSLKEILSLNFVQLEKSYMVRDGQNKEISPKRVGYDQGTAEVI